MFSTQEVLGIAREADQAATEKASRKRRCTKSTSVEIESDEEKILENAPSDSEV